MMRQCLSLSWTMKNWFWAATAKPAICMATALRATSILNALRRNERLLYQHTGFGNAVKLDEGAEARALGLAEQHLIEGGEPRAQRFEAMLLADGIDLCLNLLRQHAFR